MTDGAGLELVLVRHAETTASRAGRYLGWGDAPLTAAGEAAARRLGGALGNAPGGAMGGAPGEALGGALGAADAVHTSDLGRAVRTARLAFPGVEPLPDARLRELDFGAFGGRTYADNLAAHGDAFVRWLEDPRRWAPPGGERLDALETRVASWMRSLPAEGRVIAVVHGGSLRAALALATGRTLEALLAEPFPPACHVSVRLPAAAAWRVGSARRG